MNMTEARDAVFDHFKTQWSLNTPAAIGYVPDILWEASEQTDPIDTDKAWCRITLRHNDNQQTLGYPKAFQRFGFVTVQIFTPNTDESFSLAEKLAIIVQTAFEMRNTPDGLLFQETQIKEVEVAKPFVQINVTSTFYYMEIRNG